MGGKPGTIFARAGHEVVFSYARGNQKLEKLARGAGDRVRAGTPAEAAQEADAVAPAVHWSRVDDVLRHTGDLSAKVVLTCNLPMDAGNTKLLLATTTSGAEGLAKVIPGAHVVCAFNTVPREAPRIGCFCRAALGGVRDTSRIGLCGIRRHQEKVKGWRDGYQEKWLTAFPQGA
jgi:predicted dinucleotide-binding enzyme